MSGCRAELSGEVHAAVSTRRGPLRNSVGEGGSAGLCWSLPQEALLEEVSKEELALADQPRIFSLQKLVEARGLLWKCKNLASPVLCSAAAVRWLTSTWGGCELFGAGYGVS